MGSYALRAGKDSDAQLFYYLTIYYPPTTNPLFLLPKLRLIIFAAKILSNFDEYT